MLVRVSRRVEKKPMSQLFFFLWRGRKCTRLGPYNCVSCEILSEKDPKGPNGKSVHHKQTRNRKTTTTTTTTRKSPSQICVSPQIQQQNNKGTGQGPTKTHTQKDCHDDTVTCQQYQKSKTCKRITLRQVSREALKYG